MDNNDQQDQKDLQDQGLVQDNEQISDPVLQGDTDLESDTDQGEETTFFSPEVEKASITVKRDPRQPGTHKANVGMKPVSVLNMRPGHFEQVIGSWSADQTIWNGPAAKQQEWSEAIQLAAVATNVGDGGSDKLAYREGAHWTQDPGLDSEHRSLEISSPKIGSRRSVATGDRAMARISTYCGLGRSINLPLWQSGIWLTLKAPMLSSELELDRRIAADRVTLGRNSRGAMFSNDGVVLNHELANFVLQHTVESSIGLDTEKLLSTIKVTELAAMAVGLASTIYVNGFPYRQPCISDVESCTHVEKATLSIPKLLWVDNSKLTQKQIKLVSKRGSKVSDSELADYQAEFDYKGKDRVYIGDHLVFVLKVPSLMEHFDVGETWINDLTAATDIVFGKNMTPDERNDYLEEQAAMTRLRNHSHWIERIIETHEVDGVEEVVEHTSDAMIQRLLSQISANIEITDQILEGIEDFYAAAVTTIVGVPNYKCPSCGKYHTDKRGELHALHPIDAVSVFFQMQQSRLNLYRTPGA